MLSPLAQPRPEDPSGKDQRSSAQRFHDACEEACTRLLRSATLPEFTTALQDPQTIEFDLEGDSCEMFSRVTAGNRQG